MAAQPTPNSPDELRFPVGTRVQCNTGEWSNGTVIAHFYTEPHWPKGRVAP